MIAQFVASLSRRFRRSSGAGRQHTDGYSDRVQAELRAARLIRAIADAMLDRLMQRHHRFTLTGESLRQRPKTAKQEKNPDPS